VAILEAVGGASNLRNQLAQSHERLAGIGREEQRLQTEIANAWSQSETFGGQRGQIETRGGFPGDQRSLGIPQFFAQRRLAGIWHVAELGPGGDYVVEPLGLDSFGTLTVIQGDKR